MPADSRSSAVPRSPRWLSQGLRQLAWSLGWILPVLVLTGCVVALNPLYQPADLIRDDRLEGRWIDDEGAEWSFSAPHQVGDETAPYQLVYSSERQSTSRQPPIAVDAHLLQLGHHHFLDLTVDPKADEHSLYDLHLLPVHSFWRLEFQNETLTLQSLDARALETALEAGRAAARTVEVRNWRVLTASTADLQALIIDLADAGMGFDEPATLRRAPSDP